MKGFTGKNAFVTGAANGIGLGIADSLARAGANVAIADIDTAGLEHAAVELARHGTKVITVPLDVSVRDEVDAAAERVRDELGNLHVLVNNAGVLIGPYPVTDLDAKQWNWIIGVNLYGVIHGVSAFVPGMLEHGEEGHVINTASIGGMQVNPELRNGSYSITKYGVVALTEALALQLEDSPIGVSVLCPALVTTTLNDSAARRPDRFGGPYRETLLGRETEMGAIQPRAFDPDRVGARVLAAIENRDLFIFTHQETRSWLEERHERIRAGFDALERFDEAFEQGA